VDALVALTILAATIALALQAAGSARRTAAAAEEIRSANTLLAYLVQTYPTDQQGRSGAFTWSVEVTPLSTAKAGGALRLCRDAVQVKSQRTNRRYALATLEACPARLAA
jgi:hypothetical protein